MSLFCCLLLVAFFWVTKRFIIRVVKINDGTVERSMDALETRDGVFYLLDEFVTSCQRFRRPPKIFHVASQIRRDEYVLNLDNFTTFVQLRANRPILKGKMFELVSVQTTCGIVLFVRISVEISWEVGEHYKMANNFIKLHICVRIVRKRCRNLIKLLKFITGFRIWH